MRYFSSQRAWKIILQSLRLPFNLCTSSEEIHFRDVFPFSCLIRLQLIFSSFDAFLAAKRLFRLTGKSSSDMSDASSLQDFSKIFSLPSSKSLVQSSYPESLSKKFSSRACLRFGIVTDDKNWISSSLTKVISDAILFVFSLRGILATYTRVSRARWRNFF